MRKFIILFPVIMAAVLAGCRDEGKKSDESVRIAVRTEKMTVRNFQDSVATQGVVEPVVYAVLSALVPGRLEKLKVEEGDRASKGTLLFQSDRKNLENACRLAEEALKAAQSRYRTRQADLRLAGYSYDKADRDYKRNQTMYKSKIVSTDVYEKNLLAWQKAKIEIERVQAAVSTTEAEVALAETALAIARKKLADSRIEAPFDGVVSVKMRRQNEFCAAGTPVLKLEQPGKMRVCILLNGVYYPAVRTGKTRIEVAFAGKKLCTVPVSVRAPAIDPLSRTFEIKADLPSGCSLPSGTLCDVRVILGEHKAPALPEESLLFRQNGTYAVFAAGKDAAEEIILKTGVTRDGFTEILNPEKIAGRDIIVSGQYFVNNGTQIRVNGK